MMKKKSEPKKKVTSGLLKVKVKGKPQTAEYWINRSIDDKERDWKETGSNWVQDYVISAEHPHRQIILDELKKLEPFGGVLEAGCNAAPNLMRISLQYPENQLAGFDVSEEAIKAAKEILPNAILKVGNISDVPFPDKEFDIVIADASLMYLEPSEIENGLNGLERVCKKALIIVERVSEKDENNGYVWSRNYPKLLEDRGFKVSTIKLDETTWPHSKGWQESGQIIVAQFPVQ